MYPPTDHDDLRMSEREGARLRTLIQNVWLALHADVRSSAQVAIAKDLISAESAAWAL